MRTRILFTDGKNTRDLFWLSHDGKDVYCGPCGLDWKRSYHRSGKTHLNRQGERADEGWREPLESLEGFHLLEGLGVVNASGILDSDFFPEYSGGKADAVLIFDSRSLPKNSTINMHVGLLEPDNFGALQKTHLYQTMNIQQLLVATGVTPWVAVILSLPR